MVGERFRWVRPNPEIESTKQRLQPLYHHHVILPIFCVKCFPQHDFKCYLLAFGLVHKNSIRPINNNTFLISFYATMQNVYDRTMFASARPPDHFRTKIFAQSILDSLSRLPSSGKYCYDFCPSVATFTARILNIFRKIFYNRLGCGSGKYTHGATLVLFRPSWRPTLLVPVHWNQIYHSRQRP